MVEGTSTVLKDTFTELKDSFTMLKGSFSRRNLYRIIQKSKWIKVVDTFDGAGDRPKRPLQPNTQGISMLRSE